MTKKHFIALADKIREHNKACFPEGGHFNESHLVTLSTAFEEINPRFNRERWLGYIRGQNGPNGGAVKNDWTETTRRMCEEGDPRYP